MGSKASEPDSNWLALRAVLAHFHDYSPAEAFLVLCINGLKASLVPGFSCTATAFGDGTAGPTCGGGPRIN